MEREIRTFGKIFKLKLRNEGDFVIANELFLDHQYRFCDEVIKNAKNCIIDIGGHLGFFSIMASALNPDVVIYSYEPHIGNFGVLKENLKANHIKNVAAKQLAVSDKAGETELLLSKEDLNHSLTKAIEPTGETQKVQATTLERIFQKNKIGKCDLLKLDCEGSEYAIIYSAPKDIFKKIDNIFLEYHDWACPPKLQCRRMEGENSEKLKNYLKNLGYKVQKFPNAKMPELGFLWCTSR